MAVDSADKRKSATGMPWMPIMPTPDGTVDAQDRIQATGYYSGIAAGAPGIAAKGINEGLLLRVYRS